MTAATPDRRVYDVRIWGVRLNRGQMRYDVHRPLEGRTAGASADVRHGKAWRVVPGWPDRRLSQR